MLYKEFLSRAKHHPDFVIKKDHKHSGIVIYHVWSKPVEVWNSIPETTLNDWTHNTAPFRYASTKIVARYFWRWLQL